MDFLKSLSRSAVLYPLFGSPDYHLVKACETLDVEKAKKALAEGADVNQRVGEYDLSLLLSSVGSYGCTALVKTLLDAGVDPNARASYHDISEDDYVDEHITPSMGVGATALHCICKNVKTGAITAKQEEAIRDLVCAGASPTRDFFDGTFNGRMGTTFCYRMDSPFMAAMKKNKLVVGLALARAAALKFDMLQQRGKSQEKDSSLLAKMLTLSINASSIMPGCREPQVRRDGSMEYSWTNGSQLEWCKMLLEAGASPYNASVLEKLDIAIRQLEQPDRDGYTYDTAEIPEIPIMMEEDENQSRIWNAEWNPGETWETRQASFRAILKLMLRHGDEKISLEGRDAFQAILGGSSRSAGRHAFLSGVALGGGQKMVERQLVDVEGRIKGFLPPSNRRELAALLTRLEGVAAIRAKAEEAKRALEAAAEATESDDDDGHLSGMFGTDSSW
jgi:hypothetical protein